ncbi:hypothetical protein OXB_0293 [Bacillus sp. OxB-1]|uniref:SWIM zinc finger family protein n=1 Tax=Bacillus sp. (strain OxB-1) TaxID=98228 RepID=UPI0005822AF4|nr:SWIM zinc finger family protein [Bacillus sp. OxB-1]BAQ08765.1 hypothetical protein OXB_0293 [Bacillus sp. OxB-1]
MNIHSFEEELDKKIVDRGRDYFWEGRALDVVHEGGGRYSCIVEGSEDYEVNVTLDEDGSILYSDCDCPYDYGPICKHEVAVFFELEETFGKPEVKRQTSTDKQVELRDVLMGLSKEQVVQILVNLSEEDPILKNRLLANYSRDGKANELEKSEEWIKAIIRKYTSRGSFIAYRDASDFVDELLEVLEKVESTEDPLVALDVAFLLLGEAVDAFQYVDDSDGSIGGLVSSTIEAIETVVEETDGSDVRLAEQMLDKLLEKLDSPELVEWMEYQIDLLHTGLQLLNSERNRKKFEDKIGELMASTSSKYSLEQLLHLKGEMIAMYGTASELENFVADNIAYSTFRNALIDRYLKEGNYRQVLELAFGGERQDAEYPGLVTGWKKKRYLAYKGLAMKEEQEELAKELLFDGHFEYYTELKELAGEDEKILYQLLKRELKGQDGWRARMVYIQMIEEENDLPAILEHVRENPMAIEKYASQLREAYEDEVVDLYREFIHTKAKVATNRKAYQGVCGKLKEFGNIAGQSRYEKLFQELKETYRNKPAFQDELGKI